MDGPEAGTGKTEETTDPENAREYDERLAHFIALLSDDNEVSRWKATRLLLKNSSERSGMMTTA
jgi:hypothetical protein